MAGRTSASISLRRPNVLSGVSRLQTHQQHYSPLSPHAITTPSSTTSPLRGTQIVIEHVIGTSVDDDAATGLFHVKDVDKLKISKSAVQRSVGSASVNGTLTPLSADDVIEPRRSLRVTTEVGEVFSFRPAPVDTTCVCIPSNVVRVIELIARNIHELWSKNKIDAGWAFCPEREDEKKLHPSLIPYDELSDSEKSYDIDLVQETIKTVLAFGFEIERTPTGAVSEDFVAGGAKRRRGDAVTLNGFENSADKFLHRERHNGQGSSVSESSVDAGHGNQIIDKITRSKQFCRPTTRRAKRQILDAVDRVEDLPPPNYDSLASSTLLTPQEPILHVKLMILPETPYRQSNGYLPKPLDFSSLPSLLEPQIHDLIDRLAENVHNVWAEKRLRAGWRHGQSEDSQCFRSPHLVPFDELEQAARKANMDTAQATILSLIAYGFHFIRRPSRRDDGCSQRENGKFSVVSTKKRKKSSSGDGQ